jgi:tetratricopeptide (TPR) repeat protein
VVSPTVTQSGPAKFLVVPIVLLVLLAVPAGGYVYANNALSQAQSLESRQQYADALAQYGTTDTIAGNAVGRILLSDMAQRAELGLARTHYKYGLALSQAGKFDQAEPQLDFAVTSGIAEWQAKANAGLAAMFLDWGNALAGQKSYDAAVSEYRRVADYDPAGVLKAQTAAAMATTYAVYAAQYASKPDYPNAITWYQNLIKEFPNSVEGKQAVTDTLPQTYYNAGVYYVGQKLYDQARDAMRKTVSDYPKSTWAAKASAALSAPQPLTGKLVDGSGNPIPHRALRISTHWRIVAPNTYDDSGGQVYPVTTDAQGNFSLTMPPGQHYLVTWWDPGRNNWVTTFVGESAPVNQINVDPLQPAHANVVTA